MWWLIDDVNLLAVKYQNFHLVSINPEI